MAHPHPTVVAGDRGCTGHNRAGGLCGSPAVRGTDRCQLHAGRALAEQKARGEVVIELSKWKITDEIIPPETAMLRLMSQAFRRAAHYSDELERFVSSNGGDAFALLVCDQEMPDGQGGVVKVGEYLAGRQRLEAEERDRAFSFAHKAMMAKLDKRVVELAEEQARLVVAVFTAFLGDPELPLTADQREAARPIAARHLRALAAVA